MRPLICVIALLTLAADCQAADRPNIVYILCDDLGYGDIGCYGNEIIKTPNIDALARDGIRLTNCYSPSPVCSSSRAGIITGRVPNRVGIPDWIPRNSGVYLHVDQPSVGRFLRDAGYQTAHVGKWHLSSKMDGSEPLPKEHGFDYWFSTQNNAILTHQNPRNFYRNGKPVGQLTGWSSTIIVDEAIKWLDTIDDGPFCLFVWFHAPHEKVATPKKFTDMYPGYDDPTKPVYYGCVTMIDHEVGRLVKALDERKQRDNTFVMFMSDNGPEEHLRYPNAVNSHGTAGDLRGMKLHMHEGGYRIPGVISWPGHTKPGLVVDEPVSGVDILPTFCEIAGVELPPDLQLDGASMTSVFQGEPVQRTQPLYWEYDHSIGSVNRVAIRSGPWKLLGDAALENFELYRLDQDQGETMNVADQYPERVKELSEEMRRLHADVNGQ